IGLPIVAHRNAHAVRETESGHIYSIGGGVFAPRCFAASVAAAAIIAAIMFNVGDFRFEIKLSRWLHHFPFPPHEGCRPRDGKPRPWRMTATAQPIGRPPC